MSLSPASRALCLLAAIGGWIGGAPAGAAGRAEPLPTSVAGRLEEARAQALRLGDQRTILAQLQQILAAKGALSAGEQWFIEEGLGQLDLSPRQLPPLLPLLSGEFSRRRGQPLSCEGLIAAGALFLRSGGEGRLQQALAGAAAWDEQCPGRRSLLLATADYQRRRWAESRHRASQLAFDGSEPEIAAWHLTLWGLAELASGHQEAAAEKLRQVPPRSRFYPRVLSALARIEAFSASARSEINHRLDMHLIDESRLPLRSLLQAQQLQAMAGQGLEEERKALAEGLALRLRRRIGDGQALAKAAAGREENLLAATGAAPFPSSAYWLRRLREDPVLRRFWRRERELTRAIEEAQLWRARLLDLAQFPAALAPAAALASAPLPSKTPQAAAAAAGLWQRRAALARLQREGQELQRLLSRWTLRLPQTRAESFGGRRLALEQDLAQIQALSARLTSWLDKLERGGGRLALAQLALRQQPLEKACRAKAARRSERKRCLSLERGFSQAALWRERAQERAASAAALAQRLEEQRRQWRQAARPFIRRRLADHLDWERRLLAALGRQEIARLEERLAAAGTPAPPAVQLQLRRWLDFDAAQPLAWRSEAQQLLQLAAVYDAEIPLLTGTVRPLSPAERLAETARRARQVLAERPALPRRDLLYLILAGALSEQGNPAAAGSQLRGLLQERLRGELAGKAAYLAGEMAVAAGDWKTAERFYSHVLSCGLSPYYGPTLYRLAWIALRQRRSERALAYYLFYLDYRQRPDQEGESEAPASLRQKSQQALSYLVMNNGGLARARRIAHHLGDKPFVNDLLLRCRALEKEPVRRALLSSQLVQALRHPDLLARPPISHRQQWAWLRYVALQLPQGEVWPEFPRPFSDDLPR